MVCSTVGDTHIIYSNEMFCLPLRHILRLLSLALLQSVSFESYSG